MSGGSMNYLYSKVLHNADFPCDTPEREAFAKHLTLVAQALHDIEWVDSSDYMSGEENAAIRACLQMPLREAATQSLKWLNDEQEFADPECGDSRCSDCEVTRARQSVIDALRAALGDDQ